MRKQLILTLFWILICIFHLVVCIVEARPLFFICLFCVLLGYMLFTLLAIILDLTIKDHLLMAGKITQINNKIVHITLNTQKVRTIKLGKENQKTKFFVNQDILYVESRRSGDFVELRGIADENLKIEEEK